MAELDSLIAVDAGFVNRKEGAEVEFKKNFFHPRSPDKSYLKTAAGYANNDGGLILFGVNNDGSVCGVSDDRFDTFDPKDLTEELNRFFVPAIKFDAYDFKVGSLQVAVIQVFPAATKPVIAIGNDSRGEIHDGDVFFRYPGQTKRIRYAELRDIIRGAVDSTNQQWIHLMSQIASIGAENVSLVDMNRGQLVTQDQTLLVDEKLLDTLHFIREGSFSESDGEAVLRVTGEVRTIQGVKIVPVPETHYKAITEDEVTESFLAIEDPEDPKEYIKAACAGRTKLVPVYRFARAASLGAAEFHDFILSTRGPKAKEIAKRLDSEFGNLDSFTTGSLSSSSHASLRKLHYVDLIINRRLVELPDSYDETRYLLQAITHLQSDDFEPEVLHSLIRDGRIGLLVRFPKLATDMRRAVCHLDLIRYGYTLNG
jgi:hypothetical protein